MKRLLVWLTVLSFCLGMATAVCAEAEDVSLAVERSYAEDMTGAEAKNKEIPAPVGEEPGQEGGTEKPPASETPLLQEKEKEEEKEQSDPVPSEEKETTSESTPVGDSTDTTEETGSNGDVAESDNTAETSENNEGLRENDQASGLKGTDPETPADDQNLMQSELMDAEPAVGARTEIFYLDETGKLQTCPAATAVTAADTSWDDTGETDGWYLAEGNVAIGTQQVPAMVTVTGDVHLILADGAELTVYGGIDVAQGKSFTVYAQSTGKAMGRLTADGMQAHSGIGSAYCGTITLNGGAVAACGSAGIGSDASPNFGCNGTITINGGKVNASVWKQDEYSSASGAGIDGFVTINGGTVTATGEGNGAAIGASTEKDDCSVTINSGTVWAYQPYDMPTLYSGAAIGGAYRGGSTAVVINGGTVEAFASGGGAAIGGGDYGAYWGDKTTVSIHGGTVTAKQGPAISNAAAAIGGGFRQAAEVSITGGTVRVEASGSGAGIGSGADIDTAASQDICTGESEITITGGDVTVDVTGGGAGIGGGEGSDGGEIILTGGVIRATSDGGTFCGAAIGGGQASDCGVIDIRGGEITAINKSTGAGIGGGVNGSYDGRGGDITISGGTVHASSVLGAGIGAGILGNGGCIHISGGTVVASSAEEGPGIGGSDFDAGSEVTISGGVVTATGGSEHGSGIGTSSETAVPGTLMLLPPQDWQFAVTVGPQEAGAAALTGSPFASQAEIQALVQNNRYFHCELVPFTPAPGDGTDAGTDTPAGEQQSGQHDPARTSETMPEPSAAVTEQPEKQPETTVAAAVGSQLIAPGRGAIPQTGDNSAPGLWAALMLVSAAGMGGLVWNKRRRKQ